MRKRLGVCLAIATLVACGGGTPKVDRIYEDGVEIVLNHQEPYKIGGHPSTFSFKEILVIDLERDDLARAGLGSGGEWGADDDGRIFVVGFKNREDFVYRFDREGRFAGSFGKRGQGPGELQWPFFSGVSGSGQVAITDFGQKYVVYDREGVVLREAKLRTRTARLEELGNGTYLALRSRPELMTSDRYVDALTLCGGDFTDIKILDIYERPVDSSRQVPYFMWRVSGNRIIIANEARGYELWVYDLEGNLVRKIRKDHRPVRVTEEIKAAILGPDYQSSGTSHEKYFPDPLPPINQFFIDDEGRVFAMTYERGAAPGEHIWDIFDPDGVFIGRKGLSLLWAGLYGGPHYTFIRNDRLYYHRIKDSGYHELVICEVIWK